MDPRFRGDTQSSKSTSAPKGTNGMDPRLRGDTGLRPLALSPN